ncbi:unnamed protein product, partial [Heligmosomoides polygyrus]|uniref:Protein detached n=1 Tax=Heligmosomoides polygyrus TaxID=6339 RepID=A0A183FD69_HELPZ
ICSIRGFSGLNGPRIFSVVNDNDFCFLACIVDNSRFRSRDGILRVLSFKTALVVMSSAPLEDKYRCRQITVDRNRDAAFERKFLGKHREFFSHLQPSRSRRTTAAFGGSNVEPSVRSCFETVRLAPSIGVGPFLEWMKQEPQSVVWLPVMHRLATAEFAKHQAKCNVCKMFPIIGLRYRCLRCFNLDLCQNCFFSQRTAKKHKLKHPMQEYAVPVSSWLTTSSEDARDFARMVRNKFSRSKSSLGYLPVDVSSRSCFYAQIHPAYAYYSKGNCFLDRYRMMRVGG